MPAIDLGSDLVTDVLVLGGGPAALAAATAVAESGLRVGLLAGPDVAWTPNFGSWADEAEAVGLGSFLGPAWAETVVVFGNLREVTLGRGYARIARRRLRTHLFERCAALGVHVVHRTAATVVHDATGSDVTDEAGVAWRAAIVVDATGHRPAFVRREGEPTLFQAAVGVFGNGAHPWDPTRMTFMDLRTDHVDDSLGSAVPSFLYTMPLGPQRVFVEETSLIRGPAVPFPVLHQRLKRRLDRRGVSLEADGSELCLIPMDTPIPDRTQRVVGFGGAASFVNPATGYLLGRAFGTAPDLARALRDGLGAGRAPDLVARDAWSAIWTDQDVLRRELHLFGARILATLDAQGQRDFFEAFFSLPRTTWSGYLAPRGDISGILRAMGALLLAADARLRVRLLLSGGRLPSVLLRAVV